MSIIKIPFIIGAALGTHIIYTPPTKAAHDHERIITDSILQPVRVIPYTKTIHWIFAIVEVAAVIAYNIKSPASGRVLKLLLVDANAEYLHVTPLSAFGTILSLCGGLIRIACYRQLGRHFTFELAIRDGHKLITSGPYAIVRHPSYSGGMVTVLGALCIQCSRGSWLWESEISSFWVGRALIGVTLALMLAPIASTEHRVRVEDAALKREFGSTWDEWARRVPYRLIPGVY